MTVFGAICGLSSSSTDEASDRTSWTLQTSQQTPYNGGGSSRGIAESNGYKMEEPVLVIAKYDYKATDDTELEIHKAEKLYLLDDSQHWWKVQNSKGSEGYVPSNYVKRMKTGLFSSLKSTLSKKKTVGSKPSKEVGLVGAGPLRQATSSSLHNTSIHSSSNHSDSFGVEIPAPAGVNPLHQQMINQSQPMYMNNGIAQQQALQAAPGNSPFSTMPPVSPKSKIVLSKYAYTAAQEDELTIKKGDRIEVLEESTDGWWRGKHVATGSTGWFPSNYITPEVSTSPPLQLVNGPSINNNSSPQLSNGKASGLSPITSNTAINQSASSSPASTALRQQPQQPSPLATAANSSPAAPKEKILFTARALYTFTASHCEEMGFRENEILEILAQPSDDPEWWLACNERGDRGLVPKNYVTMINDDQGSNTSSLKATPQLQPAPLSDASSGTSAAKQSADACLESGDAIRRNFVSDGHPFIDCPYYWGRIGRAQTDAMLMEHARPGEFIIRTGESNPKDLTLTMRSAEKNRNFKIKEVPSLDNSSSVKYNIGQKHFNTLEDLIHHYTTHPIHRNEEERSYLSLPFVHPGSTHL